MQTACDEDVQGLLAFARLAHDVYGMLDGGQDVDVLLRKRGDEGRPCVRELVLRLEVSEVGLGDGLRR